MEALKVISKHKLITSLVSNKRVKQSLDELKELLQQSSVGDHQLQLENIESTYRSMVKYTIEGIRDPERQKIYYHLLQSILELADEVKQDILSKYSGWHTYWLRANTEKEHKLVGKSIIETIDDLMFKEELDEWLKSSGTRSSNPEAEVFLRQRKLIQDVFNHLWLTDKYGEAEKELLAIIMDNDKFTWYEQSLFVSSLTLSALRTWESQKVSFLIDFYRQSTDQVKERATVGLLLVLHYHDKRLNLYPELIALLQNLGEDDEFRDHFRISILQAIRSRETERISKRLHDEILPKVAELRPKIEEKLDLDNLLPEDFTEGKNPDWSDMFQESEDIYKTMEEFSKLQMEGADVYMSAFVNLKHFDFFKTFPNWFLPFYPDHESIDVIFKDEILGEGTNELAEALYKTPFICNSDKYSLVLNLQHLPANQKSMMLKVFKMELEGLEQLKDQEESIDPSLTFRTNVTQYLQDLYRFFKLSPYKNEFEDIFRGKLDYYNSVFFKIIFPHYEGLSALADYYFGKDYFEEALELFELLLGDSQDDPQLFEKAGYCYQQLSDFEKALDMYKHAELLDRKLWTLKKIGFCLRRLGRHEQALKYYIDAESVDKENMHTIAMIGHCYLDLEDYDSALKYYFKVEYNDPTNTKILRPIAWCYFILGKFEKSKKYYEKLSTDRLSAHDYINIGHLALCTGDQRLAIENYRNSIVNGKIDKNVFLELIEDDIEILKKHKIDPDDIPIIIDYLSFDLE